MAIPILNALDCTKPANNIGGNANCHFDEPAVQAHIAIPNDGSMERLFTGTELTGSGFRDAINALLHADNPAERAHFIGTYRDITPENTDPVEETASSGDTYEIRDAVAMTTYRLKNNNPCQFRNLRNWSMSGAWNNYTLLKVSPDVIWGTTSFTDTGNAALKGLSISRFNVPMKAERTFDALATMNLRITYANNYELDNFGFVPAKDDSGRPYNPLTYFRNVEDVQLELISAGVSGSYNLFGFTGCGGQKFAALFGSLLTLSLINVKNQLGATITVTSLTPIDTDGDGIMDGWRLVVDTTDADWTAADTVTVSLKSVSTLAAAGIEFFESNAASAPKN